MKMSGGDKSDGRNMMAFRKSEISQGGLAYTSRSKKGSVFFSRKKHNYVKH